MRKINIKDLQNELPAIFFFVILIVYFSVFACYHLIFQEQSQLFRYDYGYFLSFLYRPGGFSEYMGSFVTQFCISPVSSGLIITFSGYIVYLLNRILFEKHHIELSPLAFLQVILLVALHSITSFPVASTSGFILSLGFFTLWSAIPNEKLRWGAGIAGLLFLQFAAAGYVLYGLLLMIIHEVLYETHKLRLPVILTFILTAFVTSYITSQYAYFIPYGKALTGLLPFRFEAVPDYLGISFLAFLPLILSGNRLFNSQKRQHNPFAWNKKSVPAGILVLSISYLWIISEIFDKKEENLYKIDFYAQRSDWNRVLEISARYPGGNRIIMYYTNLALYKTGQMGDRMFGFPQSGVNGLWLEWKRNEIAPFVGGEIFYQLAYNSEAYRWAFEAMVAKGPNPRCLKKLVLTSLVNGDTKIAIKYLNVLHQSLFYRSWAQKYYLVIENPALLKNDYEILEKRKFEISYDFIADRSSKDIRLKELLHNHPDNRMAYEYYMASLLLSKNLDEFASNIGRIREFGFRRIPVHYEEALLAFMSYKGTNAIPHGYEIDPLTRMKFAGYMELYSNYKIGSKQAVEQLSKNYGSTYWFYLSFVNNQRMK